MSDPAGPTRQVAVVTGGGSGIGLTCASKLAESGMSILGVGPNSRKLENSSGRANDVARGVIPTAMREGRLTNEAFRRMNVEMTPLLRLGTVDDVAGTVAFLCSAGGSSSMGRRSSMEGGPPPSSCPSSGGPLREHRGTPDPESFLESQTKRGEEHVG